jgi:Fe-S oxidoreductase
MVANFSTIQAWASRVSWLYNFGIKTPLITNVVKGAIGFAQKRSLPKVKGLTFRKWLRKNLETLNASLALGAPSVYLFVDEFTNYNDVHIGQTSVRLLNKLGYKIIILNNKDSGRPMLSKGFLAGAKRLAEYNVELFSQLVSESEPLIGIEPSAILTFRDEYPDLLRGEQKVKANYIAKHTFTLEEFIAREI